MSEIKVNKISPRTACGTVQLGDSGDTFTIPAGATINNQGTATNFGATGSASWVTTVKTGDFTAVAGEGYFVNTTSGEIDVTLPAGTAGAVVAVADYANTADTNNIILKQNGSDKIEGSTDDFVINQEGVSITLVFVDSTKGWITTDTGNSKNAFGENFIAATGGTITECGNDKIHTFTGPGTFTVCSLATDSANNEVSYVVIAGGGGGGRGSGLGAGGGAGGYRETKSPITPYTASPLCGYSTPGNRITVTATAFPITVGAGGATKPSSGQGNTGSPSTFSTITSAGGGGGAGGSCLTGIAGGSGGGGAENSGSTGSGGAGNTPPVTPPQGNAGGAGVNFPGPNSSGTGGGGGATSAGIIAAAPYGAGGGGNGATSSINGTPTTRGGGGGGSGYGPGNPNSFAGNPGPGGGGRGAFGPDSDNTLAIAGTANTGGGGGGGVGTSAAEGTGAAGGSGVVIIRYRFQ